MNSGIYKITNKQNCKIYVGQTKNFSSRKRQHFKALEEGTHYNRYLQRSFDKYGKENFSFSIIERCDPNYLNERERYWIESLQSEYQNKGYNATYAVKLFNKYDSNKKLNKTLRTPNNALFTKEAREKAKLGVRRYWNEATDEIKARHSLSKSTIDIDKIHQLKQKLAYDYLLSYDDIAQTLNIPKDIVVHTAHLQSFKTIDKELNVLITSRSARTEHRLNKMLTSLWCEGHPTSYIAEVVGIDMRNVIARLKAIRTKQIDSCRLNVINRAELVRYNQVHILKSMGFNMMDVHNKLGYSRDYIRKIWCADCSTAYLSSEQTRGINKVFKLNR